MPPPPLSGPAPCIRRLHHTPSHCLPPPAPLYCHPPPHTHTERIEDRTLRRKYTSLASSCRLPYWDWTRPNLPSLLTASTVLVLDEAGNEVEARNPFTPYQYVVSLHVHRAQKALERKTLHLVPAHVSILTLPLGRAWLGCACQAKS